MIDTLLEDVNPKGTKNVELFLGRMNPIHKGHIAIIKKMKNPVVAIINGVKSSQDKKRNPLSFDERMHMLKKVAKDVMIIEAKTGYIPAILNTLREINLEVTTVYAGDDRIASYKSQIQRENKNIENDNLEFDITFRKTDRIASATDVRNAIRDNDFDTFKTLMPKELWNQFTFLRTRIT
ncbi:MAG: adenylyltransferase/cytidyltransferase family protein [Ghiorsea sp.]